MAGAWLSGWLKNIRISGLRQTHFGGCIRYREAMAVYEATCSSLMLDEESAAIWKSQSVSPSSHDFSGGNTYASVVEHPVRMPILIPAIMLGARGEDCRT